MRLIVFRHGIAEASRADLPDAERSLTPRGIERTRSAARGLARCVEPPRVILSSPKTRALQTAAILGDVFDETPGIEPALGGESIDAIVRVIAGISASCVLLVGHEPSLSGTIGRLCGGRVELKKAGVAMLTVDRRGRGVDAILECLLTPRTLRLIAGDEQVGP